MKYIILIFILFKSLITYGQTPPDDPHWQEVWIDEFDYFDSIKWVKAHNCDHGGDAQLYLKQNVWTSGGNLVIKMDNNSVYCPGAISPKDYAWACGDCQEGIHYYTSGWVETKQGFDTQFGYIETRVKLPFGMGFFPAFWTWRGYGNAANAAEIDIFEMLGHMSDTISGTNIHKVYPDLYDFGQDVAPTGFSYNNIWNNYAIEWSPDRIIWYINGQIVRVLMNHGVVDPIRILFNFALDRNHPPNMLTPFPSYMYVDYLKVHELNKDCNTNESLCDFNFSNHDNRVKKNIIIGNGTCLNSLNYNEDIYLRASESVIINGSFTVPIGAELYIDVNTCY